MNKYLKYFIFMVILGLIVSLSLSFINELTSPIIEEQKLKKVEQSLLKVDSTNKWVSGENYINISDDEGIDSIYISLNDKNEYQFIAYYIVTKGYSNGNIESLIFINNNKKTKGIGSLIKDDPNYVNNFKDVKIEKYFNDNINNHNNESSDIISGATISSRGVVQAVITASNNYFKNVGKQYESN